MFASNAFVWKNRVLNRMRELLPIEPAHMTVTRIGWKSLYDVSIDGTTQRVPAQEIWHLRGPSWNGWEGLDGVKLAREAIGLAIAQEGYGAGSFKDGALLSGILTTEANLNADQRKSMRKSFEDAYTGQGASRIAVLSNGMKFVTMSANNADSQYVEARKFQVEEVCRAFGVLPIMVGYSDKTATYASAEQMFLAHVVHTLGPWYARIEQSASVNLLTPQERQQGYYFKFFTQALLRGAAKDRASFYSTLYNIGAISPNEIRELEDWNPYEGGNQYRVPLNMADPNAQPTGQP
mgnify:FL=1